MSGADMLMLLPWLAFGGGVATVVVLAFSRDRRLDRLLRRSRLRRR
ncbi:MAG TPA: hypothetical protein VIJ82_09610 [Streptosporangiaceae bacterium]